MRQPRSHRPDLSSMLLSSNFYRAKCEKTEPKNFREFQALIEKCSAKIAPLNIFLDGRTAKKIFEDYQDFERKNKVVIYIHATDVIPSVEQFMKMHEFNFEIKSVNWLGDSQVCKAIPVGILSDQTDEMSRFLASDLELIQENASSERRYRYYVNFDITTNISIRKQVLLMFHKRKDTYFPQSRLSVPEHYQAIRNSQFVISPPGAGPDCYRTWESIYLGSNPVVMKNSWPFEKENLPVTAIENYRDFIIQTENSDLGSSSPALETIVRELLEKFA
jgi:hypothetical protein